MGISFVRTLILYVCVIFAMRIMGKRTIGEMHPTELVVSIMISDLATVPMQSKATPLFDGIIPIFTLVILELVFAFLVLKSRIIRRILVGRSCHVVKDGRMLYKEMEKLRVTVDDIEEQIRIGGYTSLKEVSEVIIETNGQVSILPKSVSKTVTPGDLNIDTPQTDTPLIVVSDGKIRKKEMERAKVTIKDIEKALKKEKITSVKEVLYMSATMGKILHIQRKEVKKYA